MLSLILKFDLRNPTRPCKFKIWNFRKKILKFDWITSKKVIFLNMFFYNKSVAFQYFFSSDLWLVNQYYHTLNSNVFHNTWVWFWKYKILKITFPETCLYLAYIFLTHSIFLTNLHQIFTKILDNEWIDKKNK